MLNKLGDELKEARLKSGTTLQQMASKTRIDIKFLEALEKGNFSFLPELYVKAFLKEYASYVGLDENQVLKKYEYAKLGKLYEEKLPEAGEPAVEISLPEKKEEPVREDVKKETVKEARKKQASKPASPLQAFDAMPPESAPEDNSAAASRKKVLLGSIIGGTILIIALIFFIFFNNDSEIIVPEKPIDEVIGDNRKYFEEESPAIPADTSAAISSSDSLRLSIRTTDTSWVKIILDDKIIQEFILLPNSQKIVTAGYNYKITFGRSTAIKLSLNGNALAYSPGNALVSHVSIDSSGIKYLETPPGIQQAQ